MALPISLKSSKFSLKLTVLMQHQHIKALKLMETFYKFLGSRLRVGIRF